jgi:hypothetical protein
MAGVTPSGRGEHGRDGGRNGAGTGGEAATGSNDRTSGTASLPARAVRPGRRASSRDIAVAPSVSRSSAAAGGEP